MIETTLTGKTPDIGEENIKKLMTMFPEVVTEGKVDFEKLKQLLGEYVDDSNERYNFTWNGKGRALRLSQTPSLGTLRPCKEESKNWDTTQNLYIEGDNLEVLKLLQKSYYGKIKMIYIDPPYNTGKDFVYKDDFNDSIENYKRITGQIDGNGMPISTNTETSGRYHTDWLNMMYPRLRLARNLLKDDGIIFISIDDNEVHNLRKICDEVFGEDNFINCITVKLSEPSGVKMAHVEQRLPKLKEYILVYSKNGGYRFNDIRLEKEKWDEEYRNLLLGLTESEMEQISLIIKNADRTKDDINKVGELLKKASYISLSEYFRSNGITSDNEKEEFKRKNVWRIFQTVSMGSGTTDAINIARESWREQVFFPYITSSGEMYIIKGDYDTSNRKPRIQVLLAKDYLTYHPCDFWTDIRTTGLDNEGGITFKNGKKPLALLRRLIDLLETEKEEIFLDFFSGSGTFAEAVMYCNSVDGKKRKFILVQIPESLQLSLQTAMDTNSKKAIQQTINFLDSIGKPHNICEIGKERIRRAGEKIKEKYKDKENIENLDIGFKVFKLDSSNIRKWQPDYDNLEQSLLDYVDNFVYGRTELDVVYEIMLKYGLDLTYPVDEFTIAQKKVYSIGFGMLMICLDDEITTEVAKGILAKIKELSPESSRVVFKDNGFKSDSNKTNIKEILKSGGIEEFITI